MSKIIVLDAGHGGKDSGAVGCQQMEKDIVLRATLELGGHLKNMGYDVRYTRTEDATLSVDARPKFANQNKANLFLSIHCNAGGGTGSEVWVVQNATDKTKALGRNLSAAMAKTFGKDRGVKLGMPGKPKVDYAVNRISNMTSALLEMAFIDNQSDVDKLLGDIGIPMLAVAHAVNDWIGGAGNGSVQSNAPAQAAPEPKADDHIEIKKGSWNIRTSPNKNGKSIAMVYEGQIYRFDRKQSGFYHIPNLGWVGQKAVKRTFQ